MEHGTNNLTNMRFRDYIFTKMAPDGDTSVKNCNETNVINSRKLEGFKRWLSANLLLLVTICGVLFGLVLGESALHMVLLGTVTHGNKSISI
jgi:hypothetical protein